MKTETKVMDAKVTHIRCDRLAGWQVIWASGFQSAMPNQKAAWLTGAAPELLEACKLALAWDDEPRGHEWAQMRDALTTAIARAEGRQS